MRAIMRPGEFKDAASTGNPMVKTQEKQLVLDAISDLKLRVTPADVATKTGLPILKATAELNQIASETQGHLEVSEKGDVVYKFSPTFQTAYLTTGVMAVLMQVGQKVLDVGYYLMRISFGIMLIVSFVLVVALVVLVIMSILKGQDQDDRGGGGFGGGFDMSFFDWMIIRDLLFWGSWNSYEPYYYDYYNQPSTRVQPYAKSNFLLTCFSFLFGDGNPNLHLADRRWQTIAEVINNNKGVVTAEQLAPYTGTDPKNEDGVLPVLVRFNGRPEVTETGNMIYLFPDLQVHATAVSDSQVPPFLREFQWQFTTVSEGALVPVYLLAGANFFGSWWLWFERGNFMVLHAFAPLVAALTIYGTMFLVVPLLRYFLIKMLNNRIDARNTQRREYAELVRERPPELQKKLEEASHFKMAQRQIGADQIIYTTERDALEQQFEQEFDKPQ